MKRRDFLQTGALSCALAIGKPGRGAAACVPAEPATWQPPAAFELEELTISELQQGMAKGEYTAKSLVKAYPEGVQQPALDVYRDHFGDLAKINGFYQSSQNAMDDITAHYAPQVRADFNKVVANPDVMSLLTDNINLTVSLGEDYRANPAHVEQYLDSLHTQIDQ